jgi:hypothetical protein
LVTIKIGQTWRVRSTDMDRSDRFGQYFKIQI